MPPDQDKLRQRNNHRLSTLDDTPLEAEQDGRSSTIGGIAPNEIVIDGVIYDIQDFDHPGGDTIHIFGGNDVTAHYKMIHPHHSSRQVEKMMRVGKVADYSNEYTFESDFGKEMKEEVFKIVKRGKEFGTYGYFARAVFYICLFFGLQCLWVVQGTSFPLAIAYGVAHALIGLNVQHDANHGAASRKTWINDLFGWGADFIGGSKYLWMEKHWTHHVFTNHPEKDPDGLSAEPFLLFNNYPNGSPKRKAMHAYQSFYSILVLSGYWISSVFCFAEVYDLQDRGARGVGVSFPSSFVASRGKYSLAMRILYHVTNIIIPLVKDFSWMTVAHIYVLGVAGSLTLGLLFTLSHNFESAERDPTASLKATGEPVCWYKAQVETSSTYGGFISGSLTGGLNFQVEHHLFPRMSSAWYPFIAPTVREICKKHGVKYVYYPWVWQNMASTIKYTHAMGNVSHLKHNPFKGET
jgi:fatty acid desaturase (delta-4 desaturase)